MSLVPDAKDARHLSAHLRFASGTLQRLPLFPGKSRIARALLRERGPAVLRDRFNHEIAVPSTREPMAQHLFSDGVYELELQQLMTRVLLSGARFVDVGASVGVHSLAASRLVGTNGRVLAVEPSPRVLPFLIENIARNRAANIEVASAALAERDGIETDLHLPGDDRFGMASRSPRFNVTPTRVASTTLDHLLAERGLRTVDLLKVDVEGAELFVFQGAARLLMGDAPPLIVFEFADWA